MAERGTGIPVVMMGLGHVGRNIARAALEKPELKLVAAVDPAFAGQPLAEVLEGPGPSFLVTGDAAAAFAAAAGGLVLHATGSSFEAVYSQLEQAVKAKLAVISTCEELAFPWLKYEDQAAALDKLAEANGVAVVGTGVNPGFVMDRLPAFLSLVTGPVRHVKATRVVNSASRRAALQKKTGAGMTLAEFEAAVETGDFGHVGLPESTALAALGCGLEVDEVEEEVAPVIARQDYATAVPVKEGQVAGVRQVARGFFEGKEVVTLDVQIAVGSEDPRDEVELTLALPAWAKESDTLKLAIPGGTPGESATAWALVNAAPAVVTAEPGLITVLDLPAGR